MKQFSMSQALTAARATRTAVLGAALMVASGIAAAGYDFLRFEDPRGPSTNFNPTGINNAMEVAGTASFQHGFRLTGIHPSLQASITVFDVPGAFNNSTFADDTNNYGVIAGSYRDSAGSHGFIMDGVGGAVTTIDVPGGMTGRNTLTGLNDQGTRVGTYVDPASGDTRSFLQSGSTYTLLQGPTERPDILAQGINNAGQVVGSVTDNFQFARGFTFEAGNYAYFDAPGATWTQAFGINNAGVIVGAASNGLFVKDGATFTTLALPVGWNARSAIAADINDDGVVVGYFTDNGTNLMYGFLATPTAPVPEPGTWALMLVGGLLLAARRVLALRPPLAA